MKNPVDALWDAADAVGRVIGDGLTLAAEILCPRDHTVEDRLRSWESAAVAVEDEICDEAEACEAADQDCSLYWTRASVVHCNGGLWRRDGYQWRGIGHTGTCSPLSALPNSLTGPVTVVIDVNGAVACDLSSITSLDGYVRDLLADWLPDSSAAVSAAADPSPADDHHALREAGDEGRKEDSCILSPASFRHPIVDETGGPR